MGNYSSAQGNNTAHDTDKAPRAACQSPISQNLPSYGNPKAPIMTANNRPEIQKTKPIPPTTVRTTSGSLSEEPACATMPTEIREGTLAPGPTPQIPAKAATPIRASTTANTRV